MVDLPTPLERRPMATARGMGTLAFVCVLLFTAIGGLLQGLRIDLDWVRAPLSFYLVGPYGWWLQGAYMALAVALAMLGAGFYNAAPPARRSTASLLLFTIGGLALAVTALAETDKGGGGDLTTAAVVHAISAPLAFLGTTLGMLVQSWRFRDDPLWRQHFAVAFGLAVFCFVALWIHALWRELPRGLSQKVVIAGILLWLGLAAMWLRRTPGTGPDKSIT